MTPQNPAAYPHQAVAASPLWNGIARWYRGFYGPLILLTLLLGVTLLWGLGRADIATDHEAQRAVPPKEMLLYGDWIVPRINGRPYIAKPPLIYYHHAATYWMLGINEFAARVNSAMAAMALLWVTALWAKRVFGQTEPALITAMIAFCNVMILEKGRQSYLDIHLCLWLTVTFWVWWEALERQANGQRPWKLVLAGALPLAMAHLYKIPVTYLFVATVILIPALVRGQVRQLFRPEWLGAHLLAVFPFALWSWMLSERISWLATTGMARQELALRVQPTAIQQEPIWFYGVVVIGVLIPYSLFGLAYLKKQVRKSLGTLGLGRSVLVWGSLGSLLVLSLVPAKESYYIISAMPVFHLLLGWGIYQFLQDPRWGHRRLSEKSLRLALLVPLVVIPPLFAGVKAVTDRIETRKRSERAYVEILNQAMAQDQAVAIWRKVRRYAFFYFDQRVPFFGDYESLQSFFRENPQALIYADRSDFPQVAFLSQNHRQGLSLNGVASDRKIIIGPVETLRLPEGIPVTRWVADGADPERGQPQVQAILDADEAAPGAASTEHNPGPEPQSSLD